MYMLMLLWVDTRKEEYDKVDLLRIIKRVIARCVVASLLWLPRRNYLGGLFNMICWVICVIGIAVDNLGCCRIGTK